MNNIDFLRVKDISEYLGIDCNVIYRKLHRDELPGAIKIGTIWLVDRKIFMEYIRNGGDLKHS